MAKSKQTHIFATRSDLVPGLRKAESELGIQYARCGRYSGPQIEQYASLIEWEELGRNTTGDHMSGPQFLVTPAAQKINLEPIPSSGGVWSLSQKMNPDSIVFLPGGVYKDQPAIIAGHIGTIWESSAASSLYKGFVKAITKGFEKIGSYYVGPEAAGLMSQSYRMVTIGLGSPTIYDLKRG